MKKLVNPYLFSAFLFLLMMNCTSQKSMDTKPLQRQWMMVKFEEYSKQDLMAKKAELKLTQLETADKSIMNVSAFMGCNRINGSLTVKSNNQLKFNEMMMTQMACVNMRLEDSFAKKLTLVTHYKIEGHFLTLYNKDNEELMKFVASDWD